MKCLLCETDNLDNGTPCRFHPGRPTFQHGTDARFDYENVYEWSCCGESYLENKTTVPGCFLHDSHITAATIAILYSEPRKPLAEECAARLASHGYTTRTRLISTACEEDLFDGACALFLPSEVDLPQTNLVVARLSQRSEVPWLLVSNLAADRQRLALQTIIPHPFDYSSGGNKPSQEASILATATARGVRQHFSRGFIVPRKKFLSYQRVDRDYATAVKRLIRCWWDVDALDPGVDWASGIETAIETCELFMVVVKDKPSSGSYVWTELDLAIAHKRPIAVLAYCDLGGHAMLDYCGITHAHLHPGTITDENGLSVKLFFRSPPQSPFFYCPLPPPRVSGQFGMKEPEEHLLMLKTLSMFPVSDPGAFALTAWPSPVHLKPNSLLRG